MTVSTIFKFIPIDCLQRGQYQPRVLFDETSLKELATSIQTHGIIEPLIVRQLTQHLYEIIAGERRWRAAMIAGLSSVPCVIGNYDEKQTAAITLIENIQRKDLSLLEEANGYQQLHEKFHFNQHEIATLVGKSRSHIANLLRLLTLGSFVQTLLHQGLLSLGHARMLVGLNESLQQMLAQKTLSNHWSVRKLEDEVRISKLNAKATDFNPSDNNLVHLETSLTFQIGAPVQVQTDPNQGGWLKIKFYDNDTLAGLLDRMNLRYD